jgi:hypothetical protein
LCTCCVCRHVSLFVGRTQPSLETVAQQLQQFPQNVLPAIIACQCFRIPTAVRVRQRGAAAGWRSHTHRPVHLTGACLLASFCLFFLIVCKFVCLFVCGPSLASLLSQGHVGAASPASPPLQHLTDLLWAFVHPPPLFAESYRSVVGVCTPGRARHSAAEPAVCQVRPHELFLVSSSLGLFVNLFGRAQLKPAVCQARSYCVPLCFCTVT